MIYASHLLKDEDMKKLADQYEIGIETIEFSIAENLDSLDEKIKEYKERIRNMGFHRLTVHGPFLDLNPAAFDSRVREITMYRFQQAYHAAQELQAEKIIFHTGFIPKLYYLEGWSQRVAGFFNEFMEGREGMPVLMENVYDPEPEHVIKVKELVQSPDFNLCLDVGHAHCYSEKSLKTWIEQGGKYVKHLHIHNNDGTWDNHKGVNGGNLPLKDLRLWISQNIKDATATIECSDIGDIAGWYKELKSWNLF